MRADTDGVFWPMARRALVARGTLLGEVRDFHGALVQEVRAPAAGIVLVILSSPPVKAGETIATIAIPAGRSRLGRGRLGAGYGPLAAADGVEDLAGARGQQGAASASPSRADSLRGPRTSSRTMRRVSGSMTAPRTCRNAPLADGDGADRHLAAAAERAHDGALRGERVGGRRLVDRRPRRRACARSSSRISTATMPWPGAGRHNSNGTAQVMRSPCPSRFRPAEAERRWRRRRRRRACAAACRGCRAARRTWRPSKHAGQLRDPAQAGRAEARRAARARARSASTSTRMGATPEGRITASRGSSRGSAAPDCEPGQLLGRHVLAAVHRQVDTAVEQRLLDFLHEQPLVPPGRPGDRGLDVGAEAGATSSVDSGASGSRGWVSMPARSVVDAVAPRAIRARLVRRADDHQFARTLACC